MKSPLSTYNDYLDKNLIKVDDQQRLAIQAIDTFLSESLNKGSSIYLSLKKRKKFKGSISFLITGDEEGLAINGTKKVVDYLNRKREKIDFCIVGEPTNPNKLGEMIKIGRRGSLSGLIRISGTQGHVAYPHLAKNPIHLFSQALSDLCSQEWDSGNEYFPATSFQVSNIHSGDGVTNVIPGKAKIMFNFRYSTETTNEELMAKVHEILDNHKIDYTIDWSHSGYPFLTPVGDLVSACVSAVEETKDITPELSTSGGTSDGRFIAQEGTQIVELGPVNATIHQVNESILVEDLEDLSHIYSKVLSKILV